MEAETRIEHDKLVVYTGYRTIMNTNHSIVNTVERERNGWRVTLGICNGIAISSRFFPCRATALRDARADPIVADTWHPEEETR